MSGGDVFLPLRRAALSALLLLWAGLAGADVFFQPLHSFGEAGLNSPLIQANDGNLYGTTPAGGAYGFGTVFRAASDGSFAVMYSFTGGTDGGDPTGGLAQAIGRAVSCASLKGSSGSAKSNCGTRCFIGMCQN
jgi:uncharacterized repeat protein (TIGR03803 family)